MAKETMIIFVYDTQMVQREEDDPASAILYFHPTWVSDQQKAALCGQIIGTIQCIKGIFANPEIVSLQSGKFFVIEDGRYLLAVGTDRNVNDWLLKHRANTLYSLVKFFHKDFASLAAIYKGDSLSAKLYHIFETYLKMIVFGGNMFSNMPSLSLPKSAGNVFLEAIHILQCCQEFNHVLGGCILYHNKVVATQVSSDLSKRLVMTDPYRIKGPGEVVEVSYDLPLGVQLLQVYISNKDYSSLVELSLKKQNMYQYLRNKSIKKSYNNTQLTQETPVVSTMKRDQSLIFTAVPEEGSDHSSSSTDVPFIPTTKKIRPKFLNLKSISIDSIAEMKTVKPAPTTPFCGQTSICSTPLTELKKFVHQKPLSICSNIDLTAESTSKTNTELKSEVECTSNNKAEVILSKLVPYINITSNLYGRKKYSSLVNLNDVINSISKDASQYFSVNNKRFVQLDLSSEKKTRKGEKLFRTITDPTFPVFKADGTIVSHFYYNEYVKTNIEMLQIDLQQDATKDKCFTPSKNDEKMQTKHQTIKKTAVISENSETDLVSKLPKVPTKHNREHRKSLTLPLKSFSTDSVQTPSEPLTKRYSSGVQLTPLLSKLSMLAFEERSSGFCSKETTPSDFRGLTPTQQNYPFSYNKYKTSKETCSARNEDDSLQKCVLFVCGQQDVVMTMLLREEGGEEPSTVQKLWEICTEELGKLEKQLNHCLDIQSAANLLESEPYSYLYLDLEWDTVKRGGPWGANDLGALNTLHRDFNENRGLMEIIMRGGDSIIYGYHCGPSETFYHESVNTNAGVPPPTDPMGLVQLKARRRLERDHSIILL